MKKTLAFFLGMSLCLCLCACTQNQTGSAGEAISDDSRLRIVSSTYPLFLFAKEVTKDVEGVTLVPLVNQEISCLHDYSLSMADMKALESADLLIVNGAGLDDFVLDAIAGIPKDARPTVLTCAEGILLLSSQGTESVGSDSEAMDPHVWMDPTRAAVMIQGIAKELAKLDPKNAATYQRNASNAVERLLALDAELREDLSDLTYPYLIVFHDGFAYFAEAYGLTVLLSVEEEQGQEASAQVIAEALSLIEEYRLSAIFTEENSADATAQAIARESGVGLYELSMIMSGETEAASLDTYLSAMRENAAVIREALQ